MFFAVEDRLLCFGRRRGDEETRRQADEKASVILDRPGFRMRRQAGWMGRVFRKGEFLI